MKTLGDRIYEARKNRELSQSQLARMIGVSRGACGQWEQGHSSPSMSNIIEVSKILGVRIEWLATGRGQMLYKEGVSEPQGKYNVSLASHEQEMLFCYQQLDREQQKALLKLVRTMVNRQQ